MMRRRGGFAAWYRRRPKPGLAVFLTDFALLGISLLIFALFHHVLPSREEALGVTSIRSVDAPAIQQTPEPTRAPEPVQKRVQALPDMPAPDDKPIQAENGETTGYFGTKYADKFAKGSPVYTQTENGFTYMSSSVNLTFETRTTGSVVYHVADFYIKDITNYSTAFAKDTFGKGQRESVAAMSERANALIAINGDYYGHGTTGIVIRNGTLYRDKSSGNDICALFWDGTMQVYDPGHVTGEMLIAQGAYQVWDFGPGYLEEDGSPKTVFNSSVGPANPRTVLGYYEPGHYCFVCVDGRSEKSKGLTNTDTAKLMSSLGCKAAYNLDGGQTSVMTWQGDIVNDPYNGGRPSSDIVMIKE